MASNERLQELLARETADSVVREIASRVDRALRIVCPKEVEAVRVFFVDFTEASPKLRDSKYFTESCQALPDDQIIVINDAFILEIETALRTFHPPHIFFSSPHLTDAGMFALVRRLGEDPRYWLGRLRADQKTADGGEPAGILDGLTQLTLFFAGHELGHVITGQQQSFTTFVRPGSLDASVANATVKMARHIDDFETLGFRLSAKEGKGHDHEIRNREKNKYFPLDTDYANHDKWFADEAAADRTAHDILTRHFDRLDKADIYSAQWQRYLLSHALCVIGLYAWYKDLEAFRAAMGMRDVDSLTLLTLEMARDPRHYVSAASLFGEVHRFTLLRSALAIRALLEAWSANSPEQPQRQGGVRAASAERERQSQSWRQESSKRYDLTASLLDTAIKLAYVGSAAGYVIDTLDKKPFFMMFERLEQALRRIEGLTT